MLSTLIYFKLNFAIQNDLVNKANFSKLSVYLLDSDRYLKVLLGITKYFFTFNDHIAILLIVYILLSGVARSSFVKKGVASHILLVLFMLGGYAFSFFISPHDLTWHMGSALKRLSVQLLPAWVFIAFYCAKGPEKNLESEQGIKELTKTTLTVKPPG